ncbi:hypothetical protein N656DRAFT_127145 [Canariomyces notabilis]|uniref:Uncharacterized protein n=1 Tax=Canariomyces notabilis TaxID=2074819 RepID=A0AAN6TCL7_9PEZI|nr:hypothetical protein N656DRAFT_127145 [Canariomyces arenarius]
MVELPRAPLSIVVCLTNLHGLVRGYGIRLELLSLAAPVRNSSNKHQRYQPRRQNATIGLSCNLLNFPYLNVSGYQPPASPPLKNGWDGNAPCKSCHSPTPTPKPPNASHDLSSEQHRLIAAEIATAMILFVLHARVYTCAWCNRLQMPCNNVGPEKRTTRVGWAVQASYT